MQRASYDNVKAWLEKHVHTTITPQHHQDFTEMCTILQCHSRYSEWKNQIPEYFKITRSAKKKALQVFVKFEDMKHPRIVSWVECTDRHPPPSDSVDNVVVEDVDKVSAMSRLTQAMRTAIRWQTTEWRRTIVGVPKCVLCDSRNNLEVDHYPTKFATIKTAFLATTVLPVPKDFSWDFNYGRFHFRSLFADKQFQCEWDAYHLSQAQYRFLCATCNQKTNNN